MTRPSEALSSKGEALTVPQLLRQRAEKTPTAIARWRLDDTERWRPTTWQAVLDQVAGMAQGFLRLGLQTGSNVGLMASTIAEWDDCSMAVMAAGGVVVGIDAHATAEQVAVRIKAAGLDALIVETEALLELFDPAWKASLPWVVVMQTSEVCPSPNAIVKRFSIDDVLQLGLSADETMAHWDRSQPDDLALVVFTSGTTGLAKAIAYRHNQVCLAVSAILDTFVDMGEDGRQACWLPMSNLFQRMVNLCAMVLGAQTYYVPDPREVMRHLPNIRPHVFIGVPRFYEKFHQGVMQRMREGGWLRALVSGWAVRVGQAHAKAEREGKTPSFLQRVLHSVARGLVLKHVSNAVGGELRYFISGSAPMPTALLESLHGIGFPVLEAYGMSECVIPVAASTMKNWRMGTVGKPLPGIQTRIAADGELLIRSLGVFEGYVGDRSGQPVVDSEGFLPTGDIAEFDSEGFLRLTGRKSEIFKTSTGRRVSPAEIEGVLTQISGIEFAAVFGPNRKSLVAVICVAAEAPTSADEMRRVLSAGLASLPWYLRPSGVVLTRRPFSMVSGELTPNLKLRRQQVEVRYAPALELLTQGLSEPGVKCWRKVKEYGGETVEIMSL